MARDSIRKLFDNADSPTQLKQSEGDASIADVIQNADTMLSTAQAQNSSSPELANLTQLLNYAKGLQMLQAYYTDLTMNNMSIATKTAADIQTTNSSISALGITNSDYQRNLNDRIAACTNAINGIVFLFSLNFLFSNT